jgi:hypothetical protein
MSDDIPDWVHKPPLSPTEQMRASGGGGSPSGILSPPQQYDSHPDYQRVKQLHDALPWHDEDKCKQHTIGTLREIFKRSRMPHILLYELNEAVYQIFEHEGFYKPYLLEWSPSDTRRYLQRKELFYRTFERRMDAARDKIIQFFVIFLQNAPQTLFVETDDDANIATVPLAELSPRVSDTVAVALGTFLSTKDPTNSDEYLFLRLSRTLLENLSSASGYTLDLIESGSVKNPKIIYPVDSNLPPQQLCNAYLRDTPLLQVFDADLPFILPDETRFAGHWIIAQQGRGKTTLLHSMFLDDVKRNASIIVMDSKGELIDPICNLKEIQDRLVLIEPNADFPLALNPLNIPRANAAQTRELVQYIFASLMGLKFTELQRALFRNLLPAVLRIPNPTLEIVRKVLVHGFPKDQIHLLEPRQQEFFTDAAYGFNSDTYRGTRREIVWRIDDVMSNDLLRTMFEAPNTKLDIGRLMDDGRIIVINNSKRLLGKEGCEFFGRFFLSLILSAAHQRGDRTPAQKLPCYVYIDECHDIISEDKSVPEIIDQCRSQKIAIILSHQRADQLSDEVLDAVNNCAIRFANSDNDAKFLADKLRTTPEFLRTLPIGTFAAFARDLTPHALALQVPYNDLSALPQMTPAEQAAIRSRMREEFSLAPQPKRASADAVSPSEADKPLAAPPNPHPTPQPSDPHAGDHTKPATSWGDE